MSNFLTTALPWIGKTAAAAATGNVPALINIAAQAVGSVVGKKVDPTVDSISAAVAGATPEQLLALKQADNDFAAKMQALGYQSVEDLEKIAAEDRDSARKRQMALGDLTPQVGFYVLTGALLLLVCCLVFRPIPSENKAVLFTLVGTFGTAWTAAVTYFYGSSRGSDDKTKVIAQLAGE